MLSQPEDHLDTKQAARLLGLSPGTLANWRVAGSGPRFVKGDRLGSFVRYATRDLLAWRDAHIRRSTSDKGGGDA